MLAGEQAGARWRADRLRAIGRRETHPLRRKFIEMRRRLIFATVAGEVVEAEVVGEDEDDVRSFRTVRCQTESDE